MSKRGRGKRGVASCSKKLKEEELHIEFDDDMIAMGKQKSKFASWLGLTLRARFPYHIPTKKFDKQRWENLWLEAKEYWNILDDKPKDVFLKKAKLNCTNWRSKLYREYVKKNEEPFHKYRYLDPSKWHVFVASKNNPKFLERSAKATASALQNKDHHRMGSTGYRGLKDKFDGRWKQVSDSNSSAQKLQNQCSQVWVAGRASRNKQTGLYEVNDIQAKVHGGLYKCGRQQNQTHAETRSDGMVNANQDRQSVDASTGIHSCASGEPYIDYPDIQDICKCDLLSPDDLPRETTIAKGQAYPTRIRILHSKRINDDCVKVQVDTVIQGYEDTDVPPETVEDEVKHMDDTLSRFIQWPKKALKIVNTEAPHKSASASGKAPGHSASRQFQTSPQTHNCDIEASTSAYIPEFVSPEVNEVEQQRPSTVDIDAINFVDSNDFVESLWAIPIVNQILQPQNKESDQEKQARKIKSALNAIKERPTWVQGMVSELEKHVGNYHLQPVPIEFSLPDGMYPYILKDFIEIEALLQVFANGWLDITIIHWFAALFYTVSNDGEKDNPCAFFGPNSINGEMCQQKPEEVKGHILSVYELHRDKQYFLAPYLANDHWSLFIISPMKKEVFILDSLKGNKDEKSYLLSKVIEDAFKGTKFTWTMVECKQQKGGWECGYMVLGFMMEFVFTYQKDFPTKIWRTTRVATQKDIDELLKIIMPGFFARVFQNWSYTF